MRARSARKRRRREKQQAVLNRWTRLWITSRTTVCPLCRWNLSLFWQPLSRVWRVASITTQQLSNIWLQLSQLSLSFATTVRFRHAHTRTTPSGLGVFCHSTPLVSQLMFLVKGHFSSSSRPGAESISLRKISMTRSSEDICPLKTSVAVWTAVRAHRASQTFPDKTEASLGGKNRQRKDAKVDRRRGPLAMIREEVACLRAA